MFKKSILIFLVLIPNLVCADLIISKQISTGNFIEMQSNPRPGTLQENAIKQGYQSGDIEEVKMSESEFKDFMKLREWGNDLAVAKARRIKEIRIEARKTLSENTDWYVVRKYENNTAIPVAVTSYRASVRQVVQDSVTAINALTTIDAVRDYKPVWPMAPGE